MKVKRGDVVLLDHPFSDASGLKVNSAIKCGHLYTVHEDHVQKKIGNLSPTLIFLIDDCLKVALNLP